MKEFYFFTSNRNKYLEAKEIFEKHGLKLRHISRSYPELQADTLEEVAATALETIEHERVFIEDSGLFVDALRGFPGVYSSYVLKTLGNAGILKLLAGAKNRRAEFRSVIGLKAGKSIKIFKGRVKGTISKKQKGRKGFGYDPIFIPSGYRKTFAEDFELKQKISHRSKSLGCLLEYIA